MSLKPILRYVGLASKVYCLQIACCRNPGNQCGCVNIPKMTENSLKYSEKLVCKGSSRFSMNNITFQDYMSCLERQEARYVTDYRIVSENQILTTKFIQKKLFRVLTINVTYQNAVSIPNHLRKSIMMNAMILNVQFKKPNNGNKVLRSFF